MTVNKTTVYKRLSTVLRVEERWKKADEAVKMALLMGRFYKNSSSIAASREAQTAGD